TFPAGSLPTVEMDRNNFLVEILFKPTENGASELVAKADEKTGYVLGINAAGEIEATVKAGTAKPAAAAAPLPGASSWIHAIAEADRANGKLRLYLNGELAAETSLELGDASLDNDADFTVGKGFEGAVAFLRVSRGSLADAHTTIQELHAWQFDGPMLRDFAKQPRDFTNGAAGALER
ncbi:MAG: LamG-like jellyroll fold domain-containing protein, partial [Puniceicoccaceae bacterium]